MPISSGGANAPNTRIVAQPRRSHKNHLALQPGATAGTSAFADAQYSIFPNEDVYMRATLLIAAASALALAACSEKQTNQLQESTSSAIGTVHNSLQDSSAPLGQLKEQASAAIGAAKQAGAAAAALSPELKEQVDKLKEQASAVKGALQAQEKKAEQPQSEQK
ncbi:hypothetical protein [Chromobacterium sp. IRSSSOUMB001]|uniref:hypothetical protein n=1 Tax=Chromobacterium sp. IRSSSOUMB001 TaxID=2927123 RepID=UPI0020C16F25|nr:hypothetical protein [Chromobacterium sp. IRSSSOUMB001]